MWRSVLIPTLCQSLSPLAAYASSTDPFDSPVKYRLVCSGGTCMASHSFQAELPQLFILTRVHFVPFYLFLQIYAELIFWGLDIGSIIMIYSFISFKMVQWGEGCLFFLDDTDKSKFLKASIPGGWCLQVPYNYHRGPLHLSFLWKTTVLWGRIHVSHRYVKNFTQPSKGANLWFLIVKACDLPTPIIILFSCFFIDPKMSSEASLSL